MSARPQATASAGIGAILMNSPPLDQRSAAAATSSTARRDGPPSMAPQHTRRSVAAVFGGAALFYGSDRRTARPPSVGTRSWGGSTMRSSGMRPDGLARPSQNPLSRHRPDSDHEDH